MRGRAEHHVQRHQRSHHAGVPVGVATLSFCFAHQLMEKASHDAQGEGGQENEDVGLLHRQSLVLAPHREDSV